MTNTERFVADADRMTVTDTETGLLLGFTFPEAAVESAKCFNDGTYAVDNPYVQWLDEITELTPDELFDERVATIGLAAVLGIELPDYAVAWGEQNGVI